MPYSCPLRFQAHGPPLEGYTSAENSRGTSLFILQNGTKQPAAAAAAEAAKPAKPAGGSKAGSSSSGHQIRLTEKFYCSATDIYECFTDARKVMAYTQSPAEVQVRQAGRQGWGGGGGLPQQ